MCRHWAWESGTAPHPASVVVLWAPHVGRSGSDLHPDAVGNGSAVAWDTGGAMTMGMAAHIPGDRGLPGDELRKSASEATGSDSPRPGRPIHAEEASVGRDGSHGAGPAPPREASAPGLAGPARGGEGVGGQPGGLCGAQCRERITPCLPFPCSWSHSPRGGVLGRFPRCQVQGEKTRAGPVGGLSRERLWAGARETAQPAAAWNARLPMLPAPRAAPATVRGCAFSSHQ